MELSENEVKLCGAYERRGRDDLAHCVKTARVHQLLDAFLGSDLYSMEPAVNGYFLAYLHAVQRTLDPSCSPDTSTSVFEWIAKMEEKHQGDEVLALVKELDQQMWKTRRPSRIIYPLKQFLSLLWTLIKRSRR